MYTFIMRNELGRSGAFSPAYRRLAWRAERLAPVGPAALVLIVYLMVVKPF
ncbi:MAG: hypothetical protein WD535_04830 [Thermaerobacterales bacterium]